MRIPKAQVGLGVDLLDSTIRQKSLSLRKMQIAELFEAYCSDVRKFIQELANAVKETNMIGLHPFMVADAYEGERDKVVAILMSSLIPVDKDGLLERIRVMRKLLGDSPSDFMSGRYKIIDYLQYYRGVGCTKWQLQQWVDILSKSLMGNEDMLLSNIEYYKRTEEFKESDKFLSSYSEAVFWLSERFFCTDPSTIPMPLTKSTRELLRILVPRERMIGYEEAAKLFKLEYPSMIWYAACGRDLLYQTHYDDIYKMERNLRMKYNRATPMDAYERWRFRALFLKPLYKDIEEIKNGQA